MHGQPSGGVGGPLDPNAVGVGGVGLMEGLIEQPGIVIGIGGHLHDAVQGRESNA